MPNLTELSNLSKLFTNMPKMVKADGEDDEELSLSVRVQPPDLGDLCRKTKYSRKEIQRLYSGYKQTCPTGVTDIEIFKENFGFFFPLGDADAYAELVFKTLDRNNDGLINFEDFLVGLSVLCRGTQRDKLQWVFNLYDTNNDGIISRQDMFEVVTAVYDLMGKVFCEPAIEEESARDHVEAVFQKWDSNGDGVLTVDEFLDMYQKDSKIDGALHVFDTFM